MTDLDFLRALDCKQFSLTYRADWPEDQRWAATVLMRDLREGGSTGPTPEEALDRLQQRIADDDLKVDYSGH